MIELELYRCRIGYHANCGFTNCRQTSTSGGGSTVSRETGYIGNICVLIKIACLILYIYMISVIMAMHIDTVDKMIAVHSKIHVKHIPCTFQNIHNNDTLKDLVNMGHVFIITWIAKIY